jgi:hypothetical protein
MASIGHLNEARSANFIFSIGFERELTFSVQTANIADVTLGETFFYGRPKDMKLPSNKVDQDPLIFDIIVSEDYNEWITIYKWIMQCKNHVGNPQDVIKSCTLSVLDAQNQVHTQFVYLDAFPSQLSGIQYSINDSDSIVLTSTITLNYNRFKIILPNGDIIDEQFTG